MKNAINAYKQQIVKTIDNLTVFNMMVETIKRYLLLKRLDKVHEVLIKFQPENMINNLKAFELTKEQIEFISNISNILLFVQNKVNQNLTQDEIDKLIKILNNIIIPLQKTH